MPNTYTLINSATVGSGGASNIVFSSIPSTYTDLEVLICGRSTVAQLGASLYMRFNGSATSNTIINLYGNGSSAASQNQADAWSGVDVDGANASANAFSNTSLYFPNYAASGNKCWSANSVIENASTSGYAEMASGVWASSSAISQITFTIENASGNWAQFTTAYLYGIKNS